MGWKTLCRPKCLGGLGFRDLGLFNRALLAKQCWRILREPSSLLSLVLKGKYFPTASFLTAGLGSRPSYIWRSLMWGRGLLSKGVRWRIGDGRSIPIYGSNWLPGSPSLRIRSRQSLPLSSKVCDLLTASGRWDLDKVQLHFSHEDRLVILQIPLGGPHLPDQLVWNFEKSGMFSVKSCYRLGFDEDHQLQASSLDSSPMIAWWKFMWNLPIPSKCKFFFVAFMS